jgi:hypothetical protein
MLLVGDSANLSQSGSVSELFIAAKDTHDVALYD